MLISVTDAQVVVSVSGLVRIRKLYDAIERPENWRAPIRDLRNSGFLQNSKTAL